LRICVVLVFGKKLFLKNFVLVEIFFRRVYNSGEVLQKKSEAAFVVVLSCGVAGAKKNQIAGGEKRCGWKKKQNSFVSPSFALSLPHKMSLFSSLLLLQNSKKSFPP